MFFAYHSLLELLFCSTRIIPIFSVFYLPNLGVIYRKNGQIKICIHHICKYCGLSVLKVYIDSVQTSHSINFCVATISFKLDSIVQYGLISMPAEFLVYTVAWVLQRLYSPVLQVAHVSNTVCPFVGYYFRATRVHVYHSFNSFGCSKLVTFCQHNGRYSLAEWCVKLWRKVAFNRSTSVIFLMF